MPVVRIVAMMVAMLQQVIQIVRHAVRVMVVVTAGNRLPEASRDPVEIVCAQFIVLACISSVITLLPTFTRVIGHFFLLGLHFAKTAALPSFGPGNPPSFCAW